jgi:hypothetical protein
MSAHPKKAANLSVRADLLEQARAYKINLSQSIDRERLFQSFTTLAFMQLPW